MKLKKILAAAAASVLAVGTLAVSASAAKFYVPEGELAPGLIIDSNWLIQLYNTGNEAENKPAVDRNLDVTKVASMTAYLEVVPLVDGYTLEDYEADPDGGIGGAIIWSANGGEYGGRGDDLYEKYNWPNSFNNFWGLPEKDDTFEGRPSDQGGENTNTGTADWTQNIVMKYIRRFGYSLTLEIPENYRWIEGATCHQVGVQLWGDNGDYFGVKVDAYTVNDDDGNILLAFDELGNEIDEAKLKEIVDKLSEPIVDDLDPNGGSDNETPADTNAGDEGTAATEGNTPSDSSDASNTTASTSSNGNSNNSTSSSNNNGNSNVPLIIGIIAGVVVVIVVVVIVVIKKKK